MISKRPDSVARRVCMLVCIALSIAAGAAAQKPTFDIEGVVTDAQQGVLPGATVTLKNLATGLTRETATDANGRYVFTSLPPAGQYTLQTALAGFATEQRENLTFNAGQRAVVNVTLKLSAVQETVTVSGDTPIVQTTSAGPVIRSPAASPPARGASFRKIPGTSRTHSRCGPYPGRQFQFGGIYRF